MQHEYYKEYYELERKHWWFTARENILTSYLAGVIKNDFPVGKQLKILNVGCSTGRSSEYLSVFGNVISIEYDEFCCEFAAQKTGLEIIHGSITELTFDDMTFDIVCAFDVIEHVEDDLLAVSELKRVAKKEAIVFVTVPAFMELWSHHDEVNHHFRRYKLSQVKKLFSTMEGGTELYGSYFNFFLFPPVYFFRKMSNVLQSGKRRKGSGSDFEAFNPSIVNKILFNVMHFERKFINRKISLPFGVSILYCWKKT